jgi:hypothetical protein
VAVNSNAHSKGQVFISRENIGFTRNGKTDKTRELAKKTYKESQVK